jgi:hypothetical protein
VSHLFHRRTLHVQRPIIKIISCFSSTAIETCVVSVLFMKFVTIAVDSLLQGAGTVMPVSWCNTCSQSTDAIDKKEKHRPVERSNTIILGY